MDLVTGAMCNLAPKLLQLLSDEFQLHTSVKKKVKFISREVESIYAALRKVAEVPWDQLDEQVKVWAREVREASYEMEDILDTYLVRIDGCEPVDQSRLKRAMKKIGDLFGKFKARRDIAGAIEDIEKQLQEIADRRARYRIDEIVANPAAGTSVVDPRLSALYAKASQLVGIDGPRDEIIKMLSIGEDNTSSNGMMKIVSIAGFGGLGKTTLAKTVHDKVVTQFDCGAFVPVGHHPDPRKVLRDILIDLINDTKRRMTIIVDENRYTGYDLMGLDERQLINQLHKFLEGRRYFIVLDDIWNKSIWGIITLAFVDSNCGSRIIVTSRNYEVSAEIGKVYKIKELSVCNSRILLYTRAFGGEDKWPDSDEASKVFIDKILHKCQGVPLAIITMASLLAKKQKNEWSDVYNSIGFGHGDDNTKKIILFSYYDLPCYLKTCMLYLSLFPEDFFVKKNKLIWRWIAEGLVHTEQGEWAFEVGDIYFHELVNRGMILPQKNTLGHLEGCRVHDMVLHLIRDLSREENFAGVLNSDQRSVSLGKGSSARRLAFQNLLEESPIGFSDTVISNVRSFYAIRCIKNMIPPVSRFQLLRVLALEDCMTKEGYHLGHIGKLKHLRYLGLTGTPIRELPKEIGHLEYLQTLILYGTGIEDLPTSLGQLTKLMCLHADEKTRMPDWIGKLTSLAELKMYHAGADHKCFVKQLGKLRGLRVLTAVTNLQDEGHAREFLQSLSKLQNLKFLYMPISSEFVALNTSVMQPGLVLCSNLRQLHLGGLEFLRLPPLINVQDLPNLCGLTLVLSEMDQKDMEILGAFHQKLRILALAVKKLLSYIIIRSDSGFQNLERFNALFMPYILPGAMLSLESFWLSINAHDGVAFGIENLPSVRRLAALISCELCLPTEVEKAEAELRHAAEIHPNRPTLVIKRCNEDKMATESDSWMLERQKNRMDVLAEQIVDQKEHLKAMLRKAIEIGKMKTNANNKVQRFHEQYSVTKDRLDRELLPVTQLPSEEELHVCDLNRLTEAIAAKERALKILTVEYPRFAAMLQELRTTSNLREATPKLEVINVNICVRDVKADNLTLDFGLGNLSSIQGIKAHIDCYVCFPTEAEEVEAKLRHTVDIHPNHPFLEIIKFWEEEMVNESDSVGLLERQKCRWSTFRERVDQQMDIQSAMYNEAVQIGELETELNPGSTNNKVQSLLEQLNITTGRVEHELLLVKEDVHICDLNTVNEDIEAMERALGILNVENPQFAAMLEELRGPRH